MPDTSPYLIAAFNSVRTEIIERMKLRDQALYTYILGVAAFFAFSFSTQKAFDQNCSLTTVEYFLFVPLPIYSLIMTLTILHHHVFIGKLWLYLKEDLSKESPIVFWDWSNRPKDSAPTLGYNRTVAHAPRLFQQEFPVLVPDHISERSITSCGKLKGSGASP